MMINKTALTDAGYRVYKTHDDLTLFQKPVRDERGIRYFIDAYEYDWSKFPGVWMDTDREASYEVQVHLYKSGEQDDVLMLRIVVLDEDAKSSVQALEEYVDRLWHALNAGYYRFNN